MAKGIPTPEPMGSTARAALGSIFQRRNICLQASGHQIENEFVIRQRETAVVTNVTVNFSPIVGAFSPQQAHWDILRAALRPR